MRIFGITVCEPREDAHEPRHVQIQREAAAADSSSATDTEPAAALWSDLLTGQ